MLDAIDRRNARVIAAAERIEGTSWFLVSKVDVDEAESSLLDLKFIILVLVFVALLLAVAGIGVIATHAEGSATALGLILVIGAAMSWAGANIVSRAAGQVNMLSYVVWASIFAVPPLFLLSFVFEGWPAMAAGVRNADMMTWAAVLWQSVGNTMFGYAAWGWLLSRHPAATITPMALLVPVFGMGASALLLNEPLPAWKLVAATLVMSGLAVGLLWPRYAAMRRFR